MSASLTNERPHGEKDSPSGRELRCPNWWSTPRAQTCGWGHVGHSSPSRAPRWGPRSMQSYEWHSVTPHGTEPPIWDQPTQRIERNDKLLLLKSLSIELLVMQQLVPDIVGLDDTGWCLRKSKHGPYSPRQKYWSRAFRSSGMDFKESIILPETIYKIVSSWAYVHFSRQRYY